jgi:DNA processing protein
MQRLLSLIDSDWPPTLSELEEPPDGVFLQGTLPDLRQAVAIVGTRGADRLAVQFTRALAGDLARAGCTIVSGGAHGIDTAAHEGALDVGGATIAVLPGTLDDPYPRRNGKLFQRISQAGALLAERVPDPRRFASAFLARNRLIAALARVVIVAQAPVVSGALSTAAHARKLGRPVMAVPHAPWEVRGAGCLTLLANGAHVCRSSRDVLSLAAPSRGQGPQAELDRPRKREKNQDLDDDERGVSEALSAEMLSADELCERTGFSAPRVQRAILMLLLSGVIQEVGCGRYARIARF